MRFVRNLVLGLMVFGVAASVIAWTLPAEFAYRHFGDRLGPLRLHDISGTIWQGRAGSAEIGAYTLGVVDWTLQAAPLLQGVALVRVALTGDAVGAAGTVQRNANGDVDLRDVHIRMPAAMAAPALAIPALQLLGSIDIDVARGRLRGSWLVEAQGVVTWREAAVTGAAQARVGELRATFASAADGAIDGVVADSGGPLEVAGTFHATPTRYDAQARIAMREDNPQLTEALQYVGQPNADGSRQLLIEGRQLGIF